MARHREIVEHVDQLTGNRNGEDRKPRHCGSKMPPRHGGNREQNRNPDVDVEHILREADGLDDGELDGLDSGGFQSGSGALGGSSERNIVVHRRAAGGRRLSRRLALRFRRDARAAATA
jgi:hypothetical protein